VRPSASVAFAVALSAIALAAIVVGFAVIGSPDHVRRQRLDEQRVAELKTLSESIRGFRRNYGHLPDTLEQLTTSGALYQQMRHGPYEYRTTGDSAFELCAEFAEPWSDAATAAGNPGPWSHRQGRSCFTLQAPPPERR
jgi:type II secretory pathway pseudopilin PulG